MTPEEIEELVDSFDPEKGLISPAPLPDKLCEDGELGCDGAPELPDEHDDHEGHDHEEDGAVAGVHAIAALCVGSAALALF